MAHLYFLQPHRPTLKNPKEPPSNRTKTLQQWTDKAQSNFIGDFLLQPKSWVEKKEIQS